MLSGICSFRSTRFACLLVAALSIGACARNPAEQNAAMANASAATPGSQQDFVVNVGDRVWFQVDSSELTQQSIATLEKQAQWLRAYPQYAFLIEGHADERGTAEYNLALGERRARAARDYLVSQGIAADRISLVSFGEERPECSEHVEACWARNRRAEFLIKPK